MMVELDPSQLPRHVAVIMDGNGRWAQQRGLTRLHGHRVGKESVRAVIEAGKRLRLEDLSPFAFSSEKWQRPPREVDGVMKLLRRHPESERGQMMEHQNRPPPVRGPGPP